MRRKHALCIGINDYPGSGADLNGCINDALDWSNALRDRGYDVQVYVDSWATKANLTSALRDLVAGAGLGDRIVFTFSGHGTWVPDRSGDEADLRDEALVCYDYRAGGLLLDDELLEIFDRRKHGVRATIISDSCYSGTVSRAADFSGASSVAVPASAKPRFMPPENFLDADELEDARAVQDAPAKGKPRPGTVLVSGCAENEVAYDARIGDRYRGAMTAAALDVLKSNPRSTRAFYRRLEQELPSASFPQSPQLIASRSQGILRLI